MSSIFNVAILLRKSILKSKKWGFEGAFHDVTLDNIPEEWKRLFRLILVGPKQFDIQNKKDDAERRVMNIPQMCIARTYSENHVSEKRTKSFSAHQSFLMPQQVATAVVMRHTEINRVFSFFIGKVSMLIILKRCS